MHLKHVLPSKSRAELILNGVVPIAQSVQQMEQHLYRMGTL